MRIAIVMTVIGPDRPGLVDLVAGVVVDHGGDWLESRMSHLGGQFAGILRVRIDADREEAFCRAIQGLETRGLTVVFHEDREAAKPRDQPVALLEVVGQDRPGIVRQISRALAAQGVNVEELKTECANAPMSGELLFTAQIQLRIPESCDLASLRATLEKIATDLMVDVSLVEAGSRPLN
jgi:glycine cleavage system regulatory protein